MSKDKSPPLLTNSKSYDDWIKLINIWRDFTSLEKPKQALAVVLSLEDKAQEAALELPRDQLNQDNGVDLIIKRLDKIFKKDELSQKFNSLEAFENYRRPENTSIRNFVTEFEKRHYKVKSYGIDISDDLLGFRLLKAANLSTRDEQLIKATVSDIKYEEIKTKLTKIFSEQNTPSPSNVEIKTEPTFHTQQANYEINVQEFTDYYGEDQELNSDESTNNTFYGNYRSNQFTNRGRGKQRFQQNNEASGSSYTSNWRRPDQTPRKRLTKGKNPPDRSGMPTRCAICQSINHWAQYCPDRIETKEHHTLLTENEIILHLGNTNNSNDLKSLVAETWSTALLDCGASKTVCGQEWFNQYKQTLSPETKEKIITNESNNIYRFGDGRKITASENVTIPATIGNIDITINADIVDNDIPLLLSRPSMKKANMILDFEKDTITAFGKDIPLITTSSGHYAIAISKPANIAHQLEKGTVSNITLTIKDETKNDHEMATKLHRQFAHPNENKLLNLINSAGHPWSENQNLKDEIKKISQECQVCKRYKRPPPRPIVGLPTASKFQETVALDLKFYNGKPILHMIDHATRLSAASIIPNKNPETVIKHMFKHWISVYGSAESFLSDNGGEFVNQQFLELCEQLGINVKTTAAESPWSNGLIERHNLILADMIDKVIADTNCSLELAVAWSINAKNSLQNVQGFSPYQLSIGTNPILPSVTNNKLPALTNEPTFNIIRQNLQALHKAREAFIQAENSSKIKRALSHNIRTSGDIKYLSGDVVLYKRLNNNEWHGPAKVLAQDGQQILLKHGGVYVRVHPCRIQLANPNTEMNNTNSNSNTLDNETQTETTLHKRKLCINDESDEELESNTSNNQEQNINQESRDTPQHIEQEYDQNQQTTETSCITMNKLKPKMRIKFQENDNTWTTATIINRAGKASGKYSNWWNITTPEGEIAKDLSKVTQIQEDIHDQHFNNTENITYDTFMVKDENEVHKAKMSELQQWKEQNVYNEVEDEGQNTISLRWVVQPKTIEGKTCIKARLCARGFEEEQPFRTDSPTCSREGVRVALTTIASLSWKLNSIDVCTAFLQGKEIERTVFVKPPKETNNNNKIWKYGN